MLEFTEASFIAKYTMQFLEAREYQVNPLTVTAVLIREGLLDEAKVKRFIEERKENIK